MEHTEGKWLVKNSTQHDTLHTIWSETNDFPTLVAKTCYAIRSEANAKRIVECVNACDGMDNPKEEIFKLKAECDHFEDKFNRSEALLSDAKAERDALRKKIAEMESYVSQFMLEMKHYKINDEDMKLFYVGWNKIIGVNAPNFIPTSQVTRDGDGC